jgi:hypothetical protein
MLASSKDGMLGCRESGTILMGVLVIVWSLVGGVGGMLAIMELMKAAMMSEEEEEEEWSEDMVVEKHWMMRGSAPSCPPFMPLRALAS